MAFQLFGHRTGRRDGHGAFVHDHRVRGRSCDRERRILVDRADPGDLDETRVGAARHDQADVFPDLAGLAPRRQVAEIAQVHVHVRFRQHLDLVAEVEAAADPAFAFEQHLVAVVRQLLAKRRQDLQRGQAARADLPRLLIKRAFRHHAVGGAFLVGGERQEIAVLWNDPFGQGNRHGREVQRQALAGARHQKRHGSYGGAQDHRAAA